MKDSVHESDAIAALAEQSNDHKVNRRNSSERPEIPFRSTRFVLVLLAAFVVFVMVLAGCSFQQAGSNGNAPAEMPSSEADSEQSQSGATIQDKTSSKNDASNNSSKATEIKTVGLGDTISTENYEIVLTSAEWLDEIYPPDTSGYYRYYEDEAGKTYLVVKGSYKNLWTDYTEPHWATDAKFTFGDKYKIDAQIEDVKNGEMSSSYAIDPLESCEIYIWASVSDEMKDSGSPVRLVWCIPRSKFNSFYSSSVPHDIYEITI